MLRNIIVIVKILYTIMRISWMQYRLNLLTRSSLEWDNREEHARVRWAYAVITAQEGNQLGAAKAGVPPGGP